jgi:prolipoprotein diacylglyceryltransferase
MSKSIVSAILVAASGCYLAIYFAARIFDEGVRVDDLQLSGSFPVGDAIPFAISLGLFIGGMLGMFARLARGPRESPSPKATQPG